MPENDGFHVTFGDCIALQTENTTMQTFNEYSQVNKLIASIFFERILVNLCAIKQSSLHESLEIGEWTECSSYIICYKPHKSIAYYCIFVSGDSQ